MRLDRESWRVPWMSAVLIAIAALLVVATCSERSKRAWRTGEVDDHRPSIGYTGDD